MAKSRGTSKVLKNIDNIYERKRMALYALSLSEAARALQDFRRVQASDGYWTNRTGAAMDLVFSDAYLEEFAIGWFIAHGEEYGVYLELANDGDNEALRPTINKFAKEYFKSAKKIYKD